MNCNDNSTAVKPVADNAKQKAIIFCLQRPSTRKATWHTMDTLATCAGWWCLMFCAADFLGGAVDFIGGEFGRGLGARVHQLL